MNTYFANTPTHLQPYLWAIRHTLEFRVWHQLEHLEWSWEVEYLKRIEQGAVKNQSGIIHVTSLQL